MIAVSIAVASVATAIASVGWAIAADSTRVTVAQQMVQAFCVDLADDAANSRQKTLRADLCAMWQRELDDAQSAPPTTTPPATTPPATTPPATTPPATTPPATTPPATTPPATTTPPPTTPPVTTPPVTTPPPTTQPPSLCPVAGKNVPGAADPWGGCFPGPGNVGLPAGTVLAAYTGPCRITTADFVIDSKLVTCDLDIRATGVIIRKSRIEGNITNDNASASSFTLEDSTVVNGARDDCNCVGTHDFTMTRVEVIGGNRSVYCTDRCTIQDSWLHAQSLSTGQHASGLREEQYTVATHNSIACDWATPNDVTDTGCSANLTGYPDFAPINHNTISRNLFVSVPRVVQSSHEPLGAGTTTAYCAFGGTSAGKPYSNDPTNATYQVFSENVFQRGVTGKCGDYGPVGDWGKGRTGNVFSGNVWDDGTSVPVPS